ncbi:MAG: hypothetical protein ACYSWP_25735 [Planctomycetota bacterium]|jgi:hypothetical protein
MKSFSIWTKRGRKWYWLAFHVEEEHARVMLEHYCHPKWNYKDVALLKGKDKPGYYPSSVVSEKVLLEHSEIIERKIRK